jgi:uncharacterized protein
MKQRSYHLHDGKSGAAITVRIIPNSSRNEISGILEDGTVTIRLTPQASDEKTNAALLSFLGDVLQVKPTQLEIVAGLNGPDKLITIMDIDKSLVQDRIVTRIR